LIIATEVRDRLIGDRIPATYFGCHSNRWDCHKNPLDIVVDNVCSNMEQNIIFVAGQMLIEKILDKKLWSF
jgi:hypothetical protein